jgi:hypothetical protein
MNDASDAGPGKGFQSTRIRQEPTETIFSNSGKVGHLPNVPEV